ncbi:hypothetical protein C9J12_21090 [Photobacterium frigidiphilum]|uniref:TraG N-terminal Proteobacteria domain-containing protein n=1 Tax=Photobacterium frigidiphilum TaxID=264736 RepID=A0A2T3JA89_9GAMM|nr:conjugal transfer protein TraG N-terminal domain-containing protein [Photobacterium frigidiphilum]PSU45741.1 hypothetical protein C9J12_21090 [Photobacterium frigidiphilum]
MVVNDYFTLFLTLQAWVISNKIYYLLSSANILVVPMILIIVQSMFGAMEEGEDEGNKGLLSLNRSGVGLLLSFSVYLFAMAPNQFLNLKTLTYNDVRSQQCGVLVTKPGNDTDSSWDSAFESLGGEKALVPAWWKLIHSLSVGITNASVSAIPCSYDITRSNLKMSEVSIQSPALQQETQQFYHQCFAQARSAMVYNTYQTSAVRDADFNHAQWLGDTYFLSSNPNATNTVYSGIQVSDPVPTVPYKASRDKGVNEALADRWRDKQVDTNAYPMCDEWWSQSRYGLRGRLATEIKKNSPGIYHDVMQPQGWFDNLWGGKKTAEERENMLIQRALSIGNIQASGRITRGYGAVLDKTGDRFMAEIWGSAVGGVGLEIGRAFMEPAFFILREALPMFQALMLSMMIMANPIILLLGMYQWRVLGTMSVAYFGLVYFTFWWEWCRSLESKLLTAMYSGHDNINPITGAMNLLDSEIIRVVLVIMYILVPGIWLAMLGFAGYQLTSLSSSFNEGLNTLKTSVEKSTNNIMTKIK